MPDHPLIVGLVLDGGQGRRMGNMRKGDLVLAGESLRSRVQRRLAPQCDHLIVSTGRFYPAPKGDYSAFLPDREGGLTGPCAGLLEGARWCIEHAPDALLLSVAADTPLFPTDFAIRALPLLDGNHACVVGACRRRDYPTNALWRVAPLRDILESAVPGPRGPRVRDVQRAMGAAILDYGTAADENPFAGINTPEDHAAMARRLETKS